MMTNDPNANVNVGSVVTATVREIHAPRGFVIVRFGDKERSSALMAMYECEQGTADEKKVAFDALKLGSVVTGKIIKRDGDGRNVRLRLSVRQNKQDDRDRERRDFRDRDQSTKQAQVEALVRANKEHGVVSGVVTSKEHYGVFVQVSEKLRALLPVAEMCGGWNEREERLAALQVGDRVEGVFIVKDGGRQFALSEKNAEASKDAAAERQRINEQYKADVTEAFASPRTAVVYHDLGSTGLDGTDTGLILDYNGVHVWLREKDLGVASELRNTISELTVRLVGFDADHDDMPFVVRAD